MAAKKKEIKLKEVKKEKKVKTRVKINRTSLLLIALVLFVVTAIYMGRGLFVAATVNGQVISRLEIIKRLEAQGGQQVADSLITEKLIKQEAKNRGVSVSNEILQERIGEIEGEFAAQGQELDSLLALQGLGRTEFEEQIELQLLVEQMFAGQGEPTDEEVGEFLEQNAVSFPEDLDEEAKRDQAKEQLAQQKIGEEVQALIQKLRDESNIRFFVNY